MTLNTCSFIYSVFLSAPKSSQNAADVVNWWNLRIKDQLYIMIGKEGVHFNYDENHQIAPINPIFAQERGNSYWYVDVTNQKEFEYEWPARVRKSEGQWHAFSAVTMNADQSIFVPNTFAFMPAKENYTTCGTCNNKCESIINFYYQYANLTKYRKIGKIIK